MSEGEVWVAEGGQEVGCGKEFPAGKERGARCLVKHQSGSSESRRGTAGRVIGFGFAAFSSLSLIDRFLGRGILRPGSSDGDAMLSTRPRPRHFAHL